jgi:hypothetical protein
MRGNDARHLWATNGDDRVRAAESLGTRCEPAKYDPKVNVLRSFRVQTNQYILLALDFEFLTRD